MLGLTATEPGGDPVLPPGARTDRGGQPAGLASLSGTAFWEQFSYYGVQSLLFLYVSTDLVGPARRDAVWGMDLLGDALAGVYGSLSAVALASSVVQLFGGFAFLTPIAGSLLARQWIGRRRAVCAGLVLMGIGSGMLALDATFLVGLLLLLVGIGCFKANIASQVGDLYAPADTRRARGFQLYFLVLQVAAILAPLICGTIGQTIDWHLGFALSGVGMTVSLSIYLAGKRHLPRDLESSLAPEGEPVVALRAWDRKVIALLLALLPLLALASVNNQQVYNVYLLWAQQHFQLAVFGHAVPASWLLSLAAGSSIAAMAISIAFWRWYGRHWREPGELAKIVIGAIIAAPGPLVLAWISTRVAHDGRAEPLYWAAAFHLLSDIGAANVIPVAIALYSRTAPRGLGGTMIAICYLHLFAASLLAGYLGGLYQTMTATRFWLLHAALAGTAAVLLLLVWATSHRLLAAPSRPATLGSSEHQRA